MKFRSYSLAVIAGSLLAGSVFAQGTVAPAAAKPAVAGESAKIEAKSMEKAPVVKADVAATTKSKEVTKMVKKHKSVTADASAKQAGATAVIGSKQDAKKEMTSTVKASTSEMPKSGAGPSTTK